MYSPVDKPHLDTVKRKQPLVSIVTLNYNQADLTRLFLESTRRLTYPNFEIIVCDMASRENPDEKIKALNIPNAELFLSKKNLGFAAGNNWGMQKAKGEFIFIINNDTEVGGTLL